MPMERELPWGDMEQAIMEGMWEETAINAELEIIELEMLYEAPSAKKD